jgi:predicted RNase H-like HicB family nuclease
MKILHVSVEADAGWLIAQGLEEPGVITQARTLDELLTNIREVVDLLEMGDKELHIELILPPSVRSPLKRPPHSSRRKSGQPAKFRSGAKSRVS